MSKSENNLEKQPRFTVVIVDTAKPLSENYLSNLLTRKRGVTLLVRSIKGVQNRGGYFFCIAKNDNGTFSLETMEQVPVAQFSLGDLTRFVNHACGLRFDREMLQYCQSHINFRTDEES